jgi:hypothetical protein
MARWMADSRYVNRCRVPGSLVRAATAAAIVLAAGSLPGCAPVLGFPNNPANDGATLASLQTYFDPSNEASYAALTNEAERRSLRDTIVINRLRAYEIEFNQFEKRLWGDSNVISAGGDLVALALAGFGATTGSAATKSALAAATAGVVGAQAAINKDLYYQRTLPALLSQMEANRDKIKLLILNGLNQPDATYSLFRANLDLDALQRASGIPSAVGDITGQAAENRAVAQQNLDRAQFIATVVSAPVEARKEAINRYVRGLVISGTQDDLAKLDAIATALGVSRGGNAAEERNNILLEIARTVRTQQDMDNLSSKLNGITKQEF